MFPVILESLVSTCFHANGVSLDLKQPTENMHAFSTQSCVRVLRGCMNLLNLRISMGSTGDSTLSKHVESVFSSGADCHDSLETAWYSFIEAT